MQRTQITGESSVLSIREISSRGQFMEMNREWDDVLERCKDRNIFLTWEYLSTYWKHFGNGKRLRILVIEDTGNIIAIAPLRQSRYGSLGPLGYDVIEPLGYRGLTPEGADYTGLILTEREAECTELFMKHLLGDVSWDFMYLMDVPDTSKDPTLLASIARQLSLKFELERGAMCPYIPIPRSLDVFLNTLSPKFRKNLRRCMSNLEKNCGKVKLVKYDELGSIEESMQVFFDLHQKRWKLKRKPGVFDTQEIRDFYLDVAKRFANSGWLALYFLTVNDEPIATQYCFEYKQRMYYTLGGFEPNYSEYSVGNLVTLKVIEKCIEKGIEEYDLLKGGETYKSRFTAKYRSNLGIRLANKRLISNFYHYGIRTLKRTKMNRLLDKFGTRYS